MLLTDLVPPGLSFDAVETYIGGIVQWVRLGAEVASLLIITAGIVATSYKAFRAFGRPGPGIYNEVRFTFSRYLVTALEYQLAADIMATAISPGWDQLGKLAVIATIRTFLNFFLQFEMKEEKRERGEQR